MLVMSIEKQVRAFYKISNTFEGDKITIDDARDFLVRVQGISTIKKQDLQSIKIAWDAMKDYYQTAKLHCKESAALLEDIFANRDLIMFVRLFGQIYLFFRAHDIAIADEFCRYMPSGIKSMNVNNIEDRETNRIEIDYMYWTFDVTDDFISYLEGYKDVELNEEIDNLGDIDVYDCLQGLGDMNELMGEM